MFVENWHGPADLGGTRYFLHGNYVCESREVDRAIALGEKTGVNSDVRAPFDSLLRIDLRRLGEQDAKNLADQFLSITKCSDAILQAVRNVMLERLLELQPPGKLINLPGPVAKAVAAIFKDPEKFGLWWGWVRVWKRK